MIDVEVTPLVPEDRIVMCDSSYTVAMGWFVGGGAGSAGGNDFTQVVTQAEAEQDFNQDKDN